jgi:hypothetical protein
MGVLIGFLRSFLFFWSFTPIAKNSDEQTEVTQETQGTILLVSAQQKYQENRNTEQQEQ